VRGYFTALEGSVGVAEQCGNVTFRTLHLLGLSLANIGVCTRAHVGMVVLPT
jgi:hypothetical protein